jgi:hypothetical protein
MSDDSVDDMEEEERDEEKIPTDVVKLSETVSSNIMDVVSKKVSTPHSDGNVETKEPRKLVIVDDQLLLDDISEGLTPQQISEKRHMRLEAVKRRLPRLQLDFQRSEERHRKIECEKATNSSSSSTQTVQNVQTPQNPVTPVAP